MKSNKNSNNIYFELAEHNILQYAIFFIVTFLGIYLFFLIMLPIIANIVPSFLQGEIHNKGEIVTFTTDSKKLFKTTNYFYAWAIDMNVKTSDESRYWFNPCLSFILVATLFGLFISIFVSSVIAKPIGLFKQKIEREIANYINKLAIAKYGICTEREHNELINTILKFNYRDLYNFSHDYGISLEDLKAIQKGIIWQQSNFIYQLFHFHQGINIYMRFHFTVKYSNSVLGFVYIGAAVLIIIVGLRGLKFIPATQPSIILFSFSLEFSLLIVYAFTLIYTKQEEDEDEDISNNKHAETSLQNSDFGTSKEVENLLRMFINPKVKK